MHFDLLARFRAFLNLVMARSLMNDAAQSWMAEGWVASYHFELELINENRTYAEYVEAYARS